MAAELVQLRPFYRAPGALLVAFDDEARPLGVVGLRVLDDTTGELRRLFVRPHGRASGLGRELTGAVIDRARALGLRRLVLNTLPTMVHAQALYRSMGFDEVDAYVADPTDGVRYFAVDLN
jgi:GNAT superfamily N-acetyltransferase